MQLYPAQTLDLNDQGVRQTPETSEFAAADLEIALKEANSNRVVQKDAEGRVTPYELCVKVSEFKKFSLGLQLYFNFLKFSIVTFALMSALSVPVLYNNAMGDGIGSTQSAQDVNFINTLSIANQPALVLQIYPANATSLQIEEVDQQNDSALFYYTNTMNTNASLLMWTDFAYTIIFLIFCIALKKRSARLRQEHATKTPVPSQYTLEVSNIPDTIVSDLEIIEFFQTALAKAGGNLRNTIIRECAIARNYYDTLYLYQDIAQISFECMAEQRRLREQKKRTSSSLEDKYKEIGRLTAQIASIVRERLGAPLKHNEYPTQKAYLVFEDIAARERAFELFSSAEAGTLLYDLYPCCRPAAPEELLLHAKHRLKVSKRVDEPSNIRWENLSLTTEERIFRGVCVALLLLLTMLLTFALLLVANIVRPADATSCPQEQITLQQAESAHDATITSCFCQQSITQINNPQVKSLCGEIFFQLALSYGLNFATAAAIVLVNSLLFVVIQKLSRFQRFATFTQEQRSQTVYLALAMLVNTALLTLFLHASFGEVSPALIVASPIPPLRKMQDQNLNSFSTDFDRTWFVIVGQKIVISMLFNIATPHVTTVLTLYCTRCYRMWQARKQKLQRDMNRWVQGEPFTLVYPYALALNTIFVSMLFASGQPLLLATCSLTLFLHYWCFKYLLLRYNSRPLSYDHCIDAQVTSLLPVAAILHLAFAIYLYGSPYIFPQNTSFLAQAVNSSLNSAGAEQLLTISNSSNDQVVQRGLSNLQLSALLLLVIVTLLLRHTLYTFIFVPIIKFFQSICRNSEKIVPEAPQQKILNTSQNMQQNEQKTFSQVFEEMKARMLVHYDIRENPEYKDFVQAIDRTALLDAYYQEETPTRSLLQPTVNA